MSDDADETSIASELDRLKHDIFRAVEQRERVPQPFFWSLFRSRLIEIRREKELQRVLNSVLDPE